MILKVFCLPAQETSGANFAAQQPRHYLRITTSAGNNLRKSWGVAQNGADLQKRQLLLSPQPVMPAATYSSCGPLLHGYFLVILP